MTLINDTNPDFAPAVAPALAPDHAATAGREAPLSARLCLYYGVGTVGVSVMINAVTTYFPALMSTVLGQSAEIAGYLLMLSKLYDAVIDVVIGVASDRTRSRWGRRRPYLLVGAVISAASFLMIFSPPALDDRVLALYMGAALILYSTGYSLFNVPYVAMASEMTNGFDERTRLWSFRTVFVSIGQLLSMAGTAALIQAGGGGSPGYRLMGLVLALVILSAMATSFFGTASARSVERATGPRVPVGTQIRLLFDNRHFVMLMAAKIFQFLAFASATGTSLLFMLNVLKLGYSGQIELSIAHNIATALSVPVWFKISTRLGKKRTYVVAVSIYLLSVASWLLADATITHAALLARGLVAGGSAGGMILMSMSMLTDTMAYDRYRTDLNREGAYSSIVAIMEKGGFAVGVALIGAYLNFAGYIPTRGGALVDQPPGAIDALYAGVAVIPLVFFLCNLLCIAWYDLDGEKLRAAERGQARSTS